MYKRKMTVRRKKTMVNSYKNTNYTCIANMGVTNLLHNSGKRMMMNLLTYVSMHQNPNDSSGEPSGTYIEPDITQVLSEHEERILGEEEGVLKEPNTATTVSRNAAGIPEESETPTRNNDRPTVSEVIKDWRLLLVNADNPLSEDYTFELAAIDSTRKFDTRAIGELKKMIEDCRAQTGGCIWAQSTYRSRQTQGEIFERKVQEYVNMGNTREEAEELAAVIVARPGTSEHHIGLAVDFNYAKTEFENTDVFEWLMGKAHNYGFILRYPEGKQSITKVIYEPWHFRYVGKEHAEIIKANDFCLEEYIDYLKD